MEIARVRLGTLQFRRWFGNICICTWESFDMIFAHENPSTFIFVRQNLLTFIFARENLFTICLQCTMCTLYSFFSFRPSALGLIVQAQACHVIEHILVPTHSVERNIEKIRFPWASNSKFVIFPQIFPCSNYKICPIIPLLFPVSNGDSPVATTFPRSNYRGFFTTGESFCPMYTLCSGYVSGI